MTLSLDNGKWTMELDLPRLVETHVATASASFTDALASAYAITPGTTPARVEAGMACVGGGMIGMGFFFPQLPHDDQWLHINDWQGGYQFVGSVARLAEYVMRPRPASGVIVLVTAGSGAIATALQDGEWSGADLWIVLSTVVGATVAAFAGVFGVTSHAVPA